VIIFDAQAPVRDNEKAMYDITLQKEN